MILIISHPRDLHAQKIIQILQNKGEEPYLLDLSKFPIQSTIEINYGDHNYSKYIQEEILGKVNLSNCTSVWWRRPQPFKVHEEIVDHENKMYVLRESQEVFGGLWGLLKAQWMNNPQNDDLAHRKVYQLRIAQEVGLSIPDTLVTNSPESAKKFIDKQGVGHVIYKGFSGTPQTWRETRLIDQEGLEKLDLVRLAPLIFQEYVSGEDFRVTVVGDKIFPAVIKVGKGSYPVDFRMNYDNMKINSAKLPKELEDKIFKLMKRLGLVYGAIDFKRNKKGAYKFLEINPAGQWLFVEYATKQPISNAIADTLISYQSKPAKQLMAKATCL